MTNETYDEDYFIRGKETGKSLYIDYSWKPDLTVPMSHEIVKHCNIHLEDKILDYGCARGYLVKALRLLGYDAWGCDISKWAIDHCDEEVKQFVTFVNAHDHGDLSYVTRNMDWIIAKDVLEHIEYVHATIELLQQNANKGIFVVVPLSKFDNGRYIVPSYEEDKTHVQRYTLKTWVNMFLHPEWRVEASYRVKGVKDNYSTPEWEKGNGFICCRRIKE